MLRRFLATCAHIPLLAELRALRLISGIEPINRRIHKPGHPEWILRAFGAAIGTGCVIHGPLTVHNARDDYRNLQIGHDVHLGRDVLLDLTEQLELGDRATISMRCTLLTHGDIGDRPLARLYPRQARRTRIGKGAYLGANVTVLAGCDVGDLTVVGASSVVASPLPPGVLAVGIPARVVRRLALSEEDYNAIGDPPNA
jgi:acetyltransferase-like isoleucine patch superfamily enzyme